MRSRYAAFALKLGSYLVRTLASGHPDRGGSDDAHAREIVRTREKQRFMDLAVLHASSHGDLGEVLFVATIFEKGKDCSFGELSSFVREGGAWRYADGIAVPAGRLPNDVRSLDRAGFLALAGAG
jgi:SEC-C motif-containing protein